MKKIALVLVLILFGISLASIFKSTPIVIIYTGNINGSLRDCGCSGEQMGGMARIKTFVDSIKKKYPNAYLIDTGDLFTSYYDPEKALFLSSLIKEMNYDFLMKSDNDFKSGITTYLDTETLHKNNSLFDYIFPKSALEFVPDSLKPKRISNRTENTSPFLIYHGSKENYLKYDYNPKKKFVFLSHTQDEMEEYDEASKTYFFQPGSFTEYVGLVYLNERNGGYTLTNHELVKMDSTLVENDSIKQRVDSFFQYYEYDHELPNKQNYFYFGADYCKSCHNDIFLKWKETNHSHAYETLKQENRAFDPECLSCHTTGFRQGGFKSLIKTPQFQNVQCESCHVDLPSDHTRASSRVSIAKVDEKTCINCHTEKNSPNFNFQEYILKINHWKKQ